MELELEKDSIEIFNFTHLPKRIKKTRERSGSMLLRGKRE
jgi:hypothetical protein